LKKQIKNLKKNEKKFFEDFEKTWEPVVHLF
jgi:hypothetical protein